MVVGRTQGRDPSAGFDTLGYLAANPDVAAAHINPLDHFLAFGIYEGVPQLTTACSSDAAMRSFETAYGRLPLAAARCS
jgi:hypothetical protein